MIKKELIDEIREWKEYIGEKKNEKLDDKNEQELIDIKYELWGEEKKEGFDK